MVADGGISTFTFEILQDQAGEQTPSQTRVSLGQADPHENSGVWKQMQSTAVEIGVQTIGIETRLAPVVVVGGGVGALVWCCCV